MRRLLALLGACMIAVCLVLPASAESSASKVDLLCTVNYDGDCRVTMTVILHLEAAYNEMTFPVPSGAACLLIITLHVFGHVIMDDKGNIGFIDAHAERVRRDHNGLAVIDEIVLVLPAFFLRQTGVVARGRDALVV